MNFIKKEFPAFNTRLQYVEFDSVEELEEFVRKNKINEHQEFYFSVNNEPCLFDCVFQYFYEG